MPAGSGSTNTLFDVESKGRIFNEAVLANTDFFEDDLAPTRAPTTFRIYVALDAAGVLNVMRAEGGVQVTEHLNENNNLAADCAYEFNITVLSGQTINLQYSANATILSCIVIEVYG